MPAPSACRPEAFQLFTDQLDALETSKGLFQASIAIAMHALPEVVPLEVERHVSRMASQVRQRVPGNNRAALTAHLHHELFDRHGLRGNVDDYYNPLNSFVPVVLESGLGIPISLALIYKVVAVRLRLRVEGINAPGHFLISVADSSRPIIVDPFDEGRMLTREEAFARMDQATGRSIPRTDHNLMPATHRQWIGRMLHNLMAIYASQEQRDDLAAMSELAALLGLPSA